MSVIAFNSVEFALVLTVMLVSYYVGRYSKRREYERMNYCPWHGEKIDNARD